MLGTQQGVRTICSLILFPYPNLLKTMDGEEGDTSCEEEHTTSYPLWGTSE